MEQGVEVIRETPEEFNVAVASLRERERALADSIADEDVVTGLLGFAEECIAMGLAGKSAEVLVGIRLHEWLFDQYGDLRRFLLNSAVQRHFTPEVRDLWNCMLGRWQLEEYVGKLNAGDVVLVLTAGARETLDRLRHDPLALLELQMDAIERSKAASGPFEERVSLKPFWSGKMEAVIRWCLANEYHVDFRESSLDNELRSVYEHFRQLGSGHQFDPRMCVPLGYPFYNSVFSVLRFAAFQNVNFADVLTHYSGLYDALNSAGVRLDHRFWDAAVLRFSEYSRLDEVQVLPGRVDIEEHPSWPLFTSEGTLAASAFLLGVGSKELKDILAKPHDTGTWFEDVVADELSNMGIPIVRRNVVVRTGDIDGEIDLVCFDALHYYVGEEKDYGPRGKLGYFSSEQYARRLEDIQSYVERFRQRVEWVCDNPSELSIPFGSDIRAVLVMSTDEPDLEVPADMHVVNIRRLGGYFGGEPVDPLLEYEALEENRSPAQRSGGERIQQVEIRGATQRQTRSIVNLFREKFGSVQAYQVYKVVWEINRALSVEGVSVMETAASPNGRPGRVTSQYVRFVAYKADYLSLDSIENALTELKERGWIGEVDGLIEVHRDQEQEMYRFRGRQLVKVNKKSDADVLLFAPLDLTENDYRLLGMTDGIWSPNGTATLLMFKEVDD